MALLLGNAEIALDPPHTGRSRMTTNKIDSFDFRSPVRESPIRWLILGGVLLIMVIAVGTVAMVGNFRERALDNSKRELENTVLLLARHFDQQFEDLEFVEKD